MAIAAAAPSTFVSTAPASISAGRNRLAPAAASSTSRAATASVSKNSSCASALPPEYDCASVIEVAATQKHATAVAASSPMRRRSSARARGAAAAIQSSEQTGTNRQGSRPAASAPQACRIGTLGG